MGLSVLHRLALGQSSAMHECIAQYGGLVWSIARRLSRTDADAEDASQEIFVELWRYAYRFDEVMGSEPAFIITIARRRLIDRLRKTAAEPSTEASTTILESLPWIAGDASAGPESSWDAAQAVRAMASLRPEHREVMELCFLNGMSHSEISKRLNMPLGTVKSFLRRGLLHVRDSLHVKLAPVQAVRPSSSFAAITPRRVDRSPIAILEPALS